MADTTTDGLLLSRRSLLKFGLLGTAVLATAGVTATLTQFSADTPAPGLSVLRQTDLPFLRAVFPVLLAGAVQSGEMAAAADSAIEELDFALNHFSPEARKLALQLFDVLAMPLTRGPLTGIWGSWEHADSAAINGFLERWQNSSLALLRQGHASLLQMALLSWYGKPVSWVHCGYPGPPRI